MNTNITDKIKYIGVDDRTLDLFESQYIIPNGVSYNSYVIEDEKTTIMDTVDKRAVKEWLENLEKVLGDTKPEYLVVSHLEPDHSAGIEIIATSPSVIYECTLTNNEEILIDAPNKMPDRASIKEIREPIVKASIYTPKAYIGDVMKLVQDKRGQFLNLSYLDEERVILEYDLPLSEIVFDFFDKLKLISY